MGRVSKYKKLKSCDPFAKKKGNSSHGDFGVWGLGDNGRRTKKRSATALAMKAAKHKRRARKKGSATRPDGGDDFFDAPPAGGDDFKMDDIMGSLRREKKQRLDHGLTGADERGAKQPVTSSVAARCSIPQTEKEEARTARILRVSSDSSKNGASSSNNGDSAVRGRMEGESMRAFDRRIKDETRMILKGVLKEGNKGSANDRKKDFLKNKKLRKKKSCKRSSYGADDDLTGASGIGDAGGFLTGERAIAAADASHTGCLLGDQVERPPVFNQLPRGAKVSKKAKKMSSPEGNEERSSSGKKHMDEQRVEAEQRAMEIMRRKVQAQYALVKAKRKKAGDFHL